MMEEDCYEENANAQRMGRWGTALSLKMEHGNSNSPHVAVGHFPS
jgi:hypothetical protein